MSVVIGIRCSEGIVLGSDSAASGFVLTGIAGDVGLGQRIRAEVESHLNAGRWTGDRQMVINQMRRYLLMSIVEQEMRAAKAAFETFGQPSCVEAARTATLVATVIENRPELIHLNETCAPTLVEDDVPLSCIGQGQQTADPFLAFTRRILWPDGRLSLATAFFSIAWALIHVIHANPNGIGDPVQLGVLEQVDGNWVARELSGGEVKEHTNNVLEAEQGLRDEFSRKGGTSSAPPAPR